MLHSELNTLAHVRVSTARQQLEAMGQQSTLKQHAYTALLEANTLSFASHILVCFLNRVWVGKNMKLSAVEDVRVHRATAAPAVCHVYVLLTGQRKGHLESSCVACR